jgi:hypothetical protein
MKTGSRKTIIVIALSAIMAFVSIPAFAQDKPADNMELVREKLRADKKLLVAEGMGLTETEAKSFWPVYDSYQKDLGKLFDRKIKLIQDYAKNYETMSDEVAKSLLAEYMAIEGEYLKLRQSFLPEFRKVLSEKRVVRYYQIENKIKAIMEYDLARQIPLMK